MLCISALSSITLGIGVNTTENKLKPLFNGNTLFVGGIGLNNYTKIQDAIDNSSDGDSVYVFDDSSPYFENLVINKLKSGEGYTLFSPICSTILWYSMVGQKTSQDKL